MKQHILFVVLFFCLLGAVISGIMIRHANSVGPERNRERIIADLKALASQLQAGWHNSNGPIDSDCGGHSFSGFTQGRLDPTRFKFNPADPSATYIIREVFLCQKVLLRGLGLEVGRNGSHVVAVEATVFPDSVVIVVLN